MLNAVNLSLTSQDLYYSLKGIEHVCLHNDNIKNIVLCCGYYDLFYDMSRGKNKTNLFNISKVYVPLFGSDACHNCFSLLIADNCEKLINPIFDVDSITDAYAYSEYLKGYYNNENRLRKQWALREWENKENEWIDLSEAEKTLAGYKRAQAHNKIIKWEASYKENLMYLNKLTDFCDKRNINLLIVVTPATKQYRMFLDKSYKEKFYSVLNAIEAQVHVLDLFDEDIFSAEDFIDTDHMSDIGSDKLTSVISMVLSDIKKGL